MDTLTRLRDLVNEKASGPRYQLVGGIDEALLSFKKKSGRSRSFIVGTGTLAFLLLLYVFVSTRRLSSLPLAILLMKENALSAMKVLVLVNGYSRKAMEIGRLAMPSVLNCTTDGSG